MKLTLKTLWKDYKYLFTFIILMVVFRSAFADWNAVPTGSMLPTIVEGDRIYVNKLAYDLRLPLTHISLYKRSDPKRGDIIIFESQKANNRLVKRVIGLPGDTVELVENRVFINGTPAVYSGVKYTNEALFKTESIGVITHQIRLTAQGISSYGNFGPITVPAGHYFVLGDNRDNSADSRRIGFVPRDEITGKAEKVVVSLNYDNYYLPRSTRLLEDLE